MSSSVSATTIEFKPRPSVVLARLLLAIHAAALLVVFLFVHHKLAMPVLLCLIGYSYYRNYRRHILHKGAGAVRRIVWQSDGKWFLEDDADVMREAELRPSSYLHPRLVILNFSLVRSKGRRSIVLCPDSLDIDTLRRIRGRLRTSTVARDSKQARYNQV